MLKLDKNPPGKCGFLVQLCISARGGEENEPVFMLPEGMLGATYMCSYKALPACPGGDAYVTEGEGRRFNWG